MQVMITNISFNPVFSSGTVTKTRNPAALFGTVCNIMFFFRQKCTYINENGFTIQINPAICRT